VAFDIKEELHTRPLNGLDVFLEKVYFNFPCLNLRTRFYVSEHGGRVNGQLLKFSDIAEVFFDNKISQQKGVYTHPTHHLFKRLVQSQPRERN